MLPNFLIIGAAKSGTTSLYDQLKGHPDIFLPRNPAHKEPTFFSESGEGAWSKGLDWYEGLFAEWKGEQAVGEASTSYTKAPAYGDAAEKIHSVIPDAKLIYVLRDPMQQIVSHYNHMLYFNDLKYTLDQVILGNTFLQDVASYAMQLKLYLALFPKEQIQVLLFEDYVADPVAVGREVCRFLDVDERIDLPLKQAKNVAKGRRIERWPGTLARVKARVGERPLGKWLERNVLTKPLEPPVMSEEAYQHARARLDQDLAELRDLVGRDFGEWRLARPGARGG
jgi:hypothetical protein